VDERGVQRRARPEPGTHRQRGQLLGRGLEFDDLEFKRRRYDNDEAYRQSKQADRMLTVAALYERLADYFSPTQRR